MDDHLSFDCRGAAGAGGLLRAARQRAKGRTATAGNEIQTAREPGAFKVFARRVITPTFGIDNTLTLFGDGQGVLVSGHGDCGLEGEWFNVRVEVTQDSTGAKGTGRTEGDCTAGGQVTWQAAAKASGRASFDEGAAEVCGHAVIHNRREGATVFDWCKNVTLSSGG